MERKPKSWFVSYLLHWNILSNLMLDIQRRVKFPTEFDAIDIATDELRTKLLPASRKLKEIEKERSERRKVRKRTKPVGGPSAPALTPAPAGGDVEMADASTTATAAAPAAGGESAPDAGKEKAPGELDDEFVYRRKEAEELSKLINEDVKKDIGSSSTGLYDLVGVYSDASSLSILC